MLWYVVAWTHDGIPVALQDKAEHRREGGKGDGEEMEGERERECKQERTDAYPIPPSCSKPSRNSRQMQPLTSD